MSWFGFVLFCFVLHLWLSLNGIGSYLSSSQDCARRNDTLQNGKAVIEPCEDHDLAYVHVSLHMNREEHSTELCMDEDISPSSLSWVLEAPIHGNHRPDQAHRTPCGRFHHCLKTLCLSEHMWFCQALGFQGLEAFKREIEKRK